MVEEKNFYMSAEEKDFESFFDDIDCLDYCNTKSEKELSKLEKRKRAIEILSEKPKQKEIQKLKNLIEFLNKKLDELENTNSMEFFLTRKLSSFPDFPNCKYGYTLNRIQESFNIYTVEDLIYFDPKKLLRVRNFGKFKMEQIENWMKKYNLFFIEDEVEE